MNMNTIIREIQLEDERARAREAKLQSFFKDRRIIRVQSTTRSGLSAEIILTERKLLDMVITEEKGKGRRISLPNENDLKMDCFGLCSIRCVRFKDNCRKCVKDFYGVM